MKFLRAETDGNKLHIFGSPIINFQPEFSEPINSRYLNIYSTLEDFSTEEVCHSAASIACKMFLCHGQLMKNRDNLNKFKKIFSPLLHTAIESDS